MGQISPPSRGQPLDLNYLNEIVTAVNDLNVRVGGENQSKTKIDTVSAGTQEVKTSDARIIGGYVAVTNSSSTSPDGEGSFRYTFSDFAYVPIVTATPILIDEGATESGKDITVVLTKVSTNVVEGVVRFNTIGVASVGLNLLIVGIPV